MTGNGGETWIRLSDIPAGRAKGVSFITNDEGWVWTKSALYSTRNNGKTWQTVNLPADIQMIESAFLQSTGNGYLCGLDGYIYRTRDSGETWSEPKYYYPDLPGLTLTISPDLHLAVFNNDSTVSMFALK